MPMRMTLRLFLLFLISTLAAPLVAQDEPGSVPLVDVLDAVIKRSTLAEPGSSPFYLKATITNTQHSDWPYNAVVEEYWVSPTKWRRTIRSQGFSQTLIVNGDKQYEENSGDYFPPDVEQLVTSLVDPIPAPVLDLFRMLAMKIKKPDGRPGQCFAETYFPGGDGEQSRALVSLDCKTGLLQYVWAPGWDAGVFDDYRSFHHKTIAHRTKDSAVVANVQELRDLDQPDEALFAIQEATPPAGRIRTVPVPGTEYRKLAVSALELNWPPVSNGPESGAVHVRLVVDRKGKVREAHSYASSNNELKEWAVEQVRKWEFKPYLIDGVAVQVETKLTLEFQTTLKPDPARLPPAKKFFDGARQLNGLRLEGDKPFHLKASFEAFGNVELTGKGTYEETWVSPAQWRREATLGGSAVVETRDGDLFYRKFKKPYAPRRADEVLDVMSFDLPGDNGQFYLETDWHVVKSELGDLPLVRVSQGYINDQGRPDPETSIYYFAPENGVLRAHYESSAITLYNEFREFAGKQVARRLTTLGNGIKVLEINIELIEPATSPAADLFTLAEVKPWSVEDEDSGFKMTDARVIKSVKPVYPDEARRQNIHEKVSCDVSIDHHGHVRGVTFRGNFNDLLEQAVRNAVMQWEFIPGTMKGHPSISLHHIEFQF